MKAALSEDGATVLLGDDQWSTVFPVSELPSQIGFYRGLRDRAGGRYARFYASTVSNLEAIAWALKRRERDHAR